MKMSAGAKWIAAVVGLLGGNVLAGVVLIGAAHHGASRVLDGYYEHAVHYDDAPFGVGYLVAVWALSS